MSVLTWPWNNPQPPPPPSVPLLFSISANFIAPAACRVRLKTGAGPPPSVISDRSEHVALIQAHAQLEFELGDPERGRTSFENVLSNFPKRSDVWSSYLDVEIKRLKKLQQQSKKNSKAAQQVLLIRQLFERVVSMKFGARGMKSLFKKFLSFEQEHGTEDTELAVQQRAKEHVLSKTVST